MKSPLKITRGADFVSVVNVTCSTSSQSFAFTPRDFNVPGAANAQATIFAEELLVHNLDATNAVYIRLALSVSTAYTGGGFGGTVNVPSFGGVFTANPTTFPAAVANTDILVPAGARNTPIYGKSVGFSVIAAAGSPLIAVTAYGSMSPPNQ